MGARSATANDVSVGQRIRAFRKAAGLSQTDLADEIGVTFQQLQKYEKGTNRVGAGRLSLIAKALDVPITAFFDGVGQSTKRQAVDASLGELMAEPRAYKLLEAFSRIPDPMQLAVLQFVRSVRMATSRQKKSYRVRKVSSSGGLPR